MKMKTMSTKMNGKNKTNNKNKQSAMTETTKALKKGTATRVTWSADLEDMLIDLWTDNIADLRGDGKNIHVYMEITEMLNDFGFLGGWTDIRAKLESLTKKYRTEKKKVALSGGAPSVWVHYEKVHLILDDLGMPNMSLLTISNSNFTECIENKGVFDPEVSSCSSCTSSIISLSESDSFEPTAAKRNKQGIQAEQLEIARKRLQVQKKLLKLQEEHQKHRLAQLQTIADNSTSFPNNLLELLRTDISVAFHKNREPVVTYLN